MSNRTIEAVLRLSSKLGSMAAFGQVASKLDLVEKKARNFNRAQSAVGKASLATSAALMRFAAPAAIGYGAVKATTDFAALERQLTRTGQKIGATREQMSNLNNDAMQIAQKYAVSNQAVVDTIDAYAETGAELADIKADLDGLVKAQQAMGAEGRDVIGTWDAGRKSFGLMSKDAERFFDIIAAGGNAGKFEGSDLAQYLPGLMPTAASNGMGGLTGTAQIVGALEAMRDRTGDSGTAATSVGDFLDKINSPEVQRNFKKFNIDLPKALEKARRDGEPLFKTMSKLLDQATKGDELKLGALFGEKDSRNFARLLMQDIDGVMERIRKLRDESAGTIQVNVDAVTKDAQAKLDHLWNSLDRLMGSVGKALVGVGAADAADAVSDNVDGFSNDLERLRAALAGGWTPLDSIQALLSGGDPSATVDGFARTGGWKSEQERRLDEVYKAYKSTGRSTGLRDPTFSVGVDANGIPYPRSFVRGEHSELGAMPAGGLASVPPDLVSKRDKSRGIRSLMDNGSDPNYSEFLRAAGGEGANTFDQMKAGMDQAATKIQSGGEKAGAALNDGAAALQAALSNVIGAINAAAAGLRAAGKQAVRADTGSSQAGRYYGPK